MNRRQLSHQEIDELYRDLCAWVEDYAANNVKHSNLRVQDFGACSEDVATLACPLENAIGLSTDFSDSLKAEFPGADFYSESLPNGALRAIVDLPIRVTEQIQQSKSFHVSSYKSSPPSGTWLLILVVLELCLGAAIRFRMV